MTHIELILNRHEIDRPYLDATKADDEIAKLHGIIRAQAQTIVELQSAIADIAKGGKR